MSKPRVLILGLDCLTPQLLFDKWLDRLPTFKRLVDTGLWGNLKSVDPPITVPAWSCMMSGYNPAQLGIYGFRHRKLGSYDELYFARSNKVSKPRVWNRLTEAGLGSGVMGVPQTFPVKKLKGWLVSGFLAPSTRSIFTFPDKMREELDEAAGGYMLDVENFRSNDRERILEDINEMTRRRWKAFRHFMKEKPQDFMMIVEMGSDRIHHAFWRFTDPGHSKFVPGNPFEHSVRDYYELLDREIAATLELVDDDCQVFVVSDHGARAMEGGFCVNDWLIDQGLLTLKDSVEIDGQTRFKEHMVDWSRTKVWAWGGYYARVFVNLEGREPNGQVPRDEYQSFLADLTRRFEEATDPEGENMGNVVLRPEDIAPDGEPAGDTPDLMVYFGDLGYRSIGSVGNDGHFVEGNDTGPDDANHDHYGIFIHTTASRFRSREAGPGQRDGLKLVDIGPTVLQLFDLRPPVDAEGQPMDLS